MKAPLNLVVASVALILAACGGSSGNSGSGSGDTGSSATPQPTVTNANPAGIYTGSGTVNGVTAQADVLVSPKGDFLAIGQNASNGCTELEAGSMTVTGDDFSGSVNGAILPTGTTATCEYPDGTTQLTGTFSGSVNPGVSLTIAAESLETSNGTSIPPMASTLMLSSLYGESGALSRLAGTFANAGTSITIGANGTGSYTSSSGCTGTVTLADAVDDSHNLYSATIQFANCTGADAVLNGQVGNGLFTIDDAVQPEQLTGALTVPDGSQTLIISIFLPLQ